MTTPNNNDNGDNKLSPTEAAIIEMMKKQALEGARGQIVPGGEGDAKHAFWDTQVNCLV